MFNNLETTCNQEIPLDLFSISGYSLTLEREDGLHPEISGNKYRKLKYNIIEAKRLEYSSLLTFGGAYSNHVTAVAVLGKKHGMKTIGIIRGEELAFKVQENPTLNFVEYCGMKLHFVSRDDYKHKTEIVFLKKLKELFGDFYLLPEGGTNALAVKGCEEILTKSDSSFDYICTSVGTGGTMAGLVNSSLPHQTVLGFSALKGVFQTLVVKKYTLKNNYNIIDDYCFGGYAKIDSNLIRFINEFKEKTGIQLDPIYTGKMMFGIIDLLKNKKLKKNSCILAIHTGGLQGIDGMNRLLKKKDLPQINV